MPKFQFDYLYFNMDLSLSCCSKGFSNLGLDFVMLKSLC